MGAMNFVRSVLGLPDRAAQEESRASLIQWGQLTPWIPMARVEDSRSDFFPDQPITYEDLAECVETFDPQRRRIPVVCGMAGADSGPSHYKGMYLPSPAKVTALDFDGLTLWGRFLPIIDPVTGEDRFEFGMKNGFTEGSVCIIKNSNETGGKAMLWHHAQLGMGEGPGIANMPSLDEWLGGGETEAARWGAISNGDHLQCEWRHFGGLHLEQRGKRGSRMVKI